MRNRATTPLSKAKVRQSWSKYNLYNLSRIQAPGYKVRNQFQQKWTAKSVLRAYHGEQVREGQWEQMFARRLRAVVPMNPDYLARNDGSWESAGRGSGVEGKRLKRKIEPTPYMQMTFAPLERRLDTAIFRAMFASSARQARQFVVHGAVKVNGKKMKFPGYLLNPGDMFQVEPDRVMFAAGAPKIPEVDVAKEGENERAAPAEDAAEPNPADEEAVEEREPREILKDLLSQAKGILAAPHQKLAVKRKQDLRAFAASVKRMLSRAKSKTILTDSLEAQFLEIQNQLKIQRETRTKGKGALPSDQAKKESSEDQATEKRAEGAISEGEAASDKPLEEAMAHLKIGDDVNVITDTEYNELFAALSEMSENPVDDSKPYATPWMPRDYMSAFAFIPRYLEVNQNVCAAVYLRHPVAKPGAAEVPTPYGIDTGASAFAWYLRRR